MYFFNDILSRLSRDVQSSHIRLSVSSNCHPFGWHSCSPFNYLIYTNIHEVAENYIIRVQCLLFRVRTIPVNLLSVSDRIAAITPERHVIAKLRLLSELALDLHEMIVSDTALRTSVKLLSVAATSYSPTPRIINMILVPVYTRGVLQSTIRTRQNSAVNMN